MSNKNEILNVINDKAFLKEFNITEKDIFKAIKLGLDEFQELQKKIDEEKRKGITFEELCNQLGGENDDFEKQTSTQRYFDLNYKSIFVTIFEDEKNDKYEVGKAGVHFYPDNITDSTATYLFILDLTEPFDLYEFSEYMEDDIAQELLKNHYSKVTDIKNTYMIAYVLEAGSDFGVKYIRKAKMNNENLQKIFDEGKDMYNGPDCSKFKIAFFNSNNQFITYYAPDLNNFERRYKFERVCEDIKLHNDIDSYSIMQRIELEKICKRQIQEKCLNLKINSFFEIPDIEEQIKISHKRKIHENQIDFEDGIIIEDGIINAYIDTSTFDVEENFGLKQLENDGCYYNVFLNYDIKKDNCEIEIIEVTDDKRKYYTYLPKGNEKEMLVKELEKYCKSIEGLSLEDLFNEEQELE